MDTSEPSNGLSSTNAAKLKYERKIRGYQLYFAATGLMAAILTSMSLNVVNNNTSLDRSPLVEATRLTRDYAAQSAFLFSISLCVDCIALYICTVEQDDIVETLARTELSSSFSWPALLFLLLPLFALTLMSFGFTQLFATLSSFGYYYGLSGGVFIAALWALATIYWVRKSMRLRRQR